MIAKEKAFTPKHHPTSKAGDKQESDVAFYLRRAFKEHPQVYVFNDLNISHNDEHAQIDHLVVYKYGLILIESKSITGEVHVNKHQEWSRSYRDKWQGMPSPIQQVELQKALLKSLLQENRKSILGKLLGIKGQSFTYRCWETLCAVSSNAIIDRDSMPSKVSKRLVKSEFLVDKLTKMMNLKNVVTQTLTFDTRPDFTPAELSSISTFLLEHDGKYLSSPIKKIPNRVETKPAQVETFTKPIEVHTKHKPTKKLACRKCGSDDQLIAMNGKYGYYVKCGFCNGNTPMKRPYPSCNSTDAKVGKRGNLYSLVCEKCCITEVVYYQ